MFIPNRIWKLGPLLFLFLILLLVLSPILDSQRVLDTPTGLSRQVVVNTQRLDVLEREVEGLRTWRADHDKGAAISDVASASRLAVLELTVGKHEVAVWALLTAVVGDWLWRIRQYTRKGAK